MMVIVESGDNPFSFSGFNGLFNFYIKGFLLKKPSLLILSFFEQISIIFILWIVGGTVYLPIAIIGGIISVFISMGTQQLPMDLMGANRSKFKQILVSSPMSPFSFILATSLGVNILNLIKIVILFAILLVLVKISLIALFQIIFALLLIWIIGLMIGYYLGSRVISTLDMLKIVRFLNLIFVMFLPIYFLIQYLPYPYQVLTLLSPTTHAAILFRNLAGIKDGVKGFSLFYSWVYLIIWTIGSIFLAIKSNRWEDV